MPLQAMPAETGEQHVKLLDLFCGRWGWSRAFAARGWECVGVDLVAPPDVPDGCRFVRDDVLTWKASDICEFDFVCASPPCEQFACFGMPHFRKNPPFPHKGVELFEHTRGILAAAGVPFVIENVRSAERFVGPADAHAGSFYLWGDGVPAVLPKVHKARWLANSHHGRNAPGNFAAELLLPKTERKALLATIPPELANCIADYAERLLEQRETVFSGGNS